MRYTFFFQMDGIHVILNLFNYKAYHMFSTCRERKLQISSNETNCFYIWWYASKIFGSHTGIN